MKFSHMRHQFLLIKFQCKLVEVVWNVFESWLEHASKRNLYYTIIRGEIIASAQANAAIDWSCPAFIGHDKLCLR